MIYTCWSGAAVISLHITDQHSTAVFINYPLLSERDNLQTKNKADGEFIEALQNDLNATDEAKSALQLEHDKLKEQLEAVQLGNNEFHLHQTNKSIVLSFDSA